MFLFKRQIAFSSTLVLLFFLVPNLVQDIHRIFGHHNRHDAFHTFSGAQFRLQSEKCPVCLFEFNVVDETVLLAVDPFLLPVVLIFVDKSYSQFQNEAFHYYNLRAPPQA